MIEIFKQGGPLAILLALIAIVLVVLTLRLILRISRGNLPAGQQGQIALQALPFWGVIALLIGFLGQAAGLFKILGSYLEREAVGPRIIFAGLRESLVTTLMGLTICILALLTWGALRWFGRRDLE